MSLASRLERHDKRMEQARHERGDACQVCGATERLEWDHDDPATKVAPITNMNGYSDQAFWAEVAKCTLLCRPCHMAKTSANGEWSNRGKPAPDHGITAYTRRKCRCDVCRAAKAVANAKRVR